MNLSVIERLIQEGDLSINALKYLLGCRGECEWLDYKEELSLLDDKELCDFTKDVIGLKNVGGGYIVVGVRDKIWEPIGIGKPLSFDTKEIRDKVRHSSGLELDVDIVYHELQISSLNKKFALILVRASRKRSKRRTPTLVCKDFCTREKYGLHRGEIYLRQGDSTIKVKSREELEELLENLEAQADRDAIQSGESSSPFAVEDGTYRLLEKGYEKFIGRHDLQKKLLQAIVQDPRIWIINVHGPGGVGKSALVNWAVYELYNTRKFEAIIQLTAKETVLTDSGIDKFSGRCLYSLDNLLDLILKVFDEQPIGDIEKKKKMVIEILSAWSTLLVLDNMETVVSDGRILNFVQELPEGTKAKVLLTSRRKTGGWELPLPVTELTEIESEEFLSIKARELNVDFPLDRAIVRRVVTGTGGLPLAIQWLLGQYKIVRNMDIVLSALGTKDSPILEFSFRNIWNVLTADAKSLLAILTIFPSSPTSQQIAIATEWSLERIEKALSELQEVTLVTKNIQQSDGRVTYTALPITLLFASNQLDTMGDLERVARQRFQKFNEQMELQKTEISRFVSIFERFGLRTDNEKRAAILCRRGESEMFAGNVDNADLIFKQARELAPQSSYVYAMNASYELARNRVGLALKYAEEACQRANKQTGALCYIILARVLDVQRDRQKRVEALQKAIDYDSEDMILRHQYGVALSRAGKENEAVEQFDIIINREKDKIHPTQTLLMSIKTRIINLKRLGKYEKAAEDLEFAKKILSENPHLQNEGYHFDDLF